MDGLGATRSWARALGWRSTGGELLAKGLRQLRGLGAQHRGIVELSEDRDVCDSVRLLYLLTYYLLTADAPGGASREHETTTHPRTPTAPAPNLPRPYPATSPIPHARVCVSVCVCVRTRAHMTTFIPIRSRRRRNPLSGHPVWPIELGRAATTCRQRRSIAVPAPPERPPSPVPPHARPGLGLTTSPASSSPCSLL